MGEDMADLRFKEANMREQLQIENMRLRDQLQEKDEQPATMEIMAMDVIQCKHPSNTYSLFLKEKWSQVYIKTLAHHGSLSFQDYRKFIEFFQKDSIKDNARMYEFYMHNLILTNMNPWDPNSIMGDA